MIDYEAAYNDLRDAALELREALNMPTYTTANRDLRDLRVNQVQAVLCRLAARGGTE